MKEANYECPAPVAKAIEKMRDQLEEIYGQRFVFFVAAEGKVIASGNNPLTGGTLKARPIPEA